MAAIFFAWDELIEIYRRIQSHETITFKTLKNMIKKNPYYIEIITPKNALNDLIHKVSGEMEISLGTDREFALSDIYRELFLIKNQQAKFTHVILNKMKHADVLKWDFPLFVVITHYMEYYSEHDTLI